MVQTCQKVFRIVPKCPKMSQNPTSDASLSERTRTCYIVLDILPLRRQHLFGTTPGSLDAVCVHTSIIWRNEFHGMIHLIKGICQKTLNVLGFYESKSSVLIEFSKYEQNQTTFQCSYPLDSNELYAFQQSLIIIVPGKNR